jgi:hypothetical protein
MVGSISIYMSRLTVTQGKDLATVMYLDHKATLHSVLELDGQCTGHRCDLLIDTQREGSGSGHRETTLKEDGNVQLLEAGLTYQHLLLCARLPSLDFECQVLGANITPNLIVI